MKNSFNVNDFSFFHLTQKKEKKNEKYYQRVDSEKKMFLLPILISNCALSLPFYFLSDHEILYIKFTNERFQKLHYLPSSPMEIEIFWQVLKKLFSYIQHVAEVKIKSLIYYYDTHYIRNYEGMTCVLSFYRNLHKMDTDSLQNCNFH